MNTELKKDILSRLQKGESIKAIAQEFTNVINEANTQYKIDQAEEQKKKDAIKHDKVLAISSLIDALGEIGTVWGFQEEAEKLVDSISQEDIEEMINVFDETLPAVMQYAAIADAFTKNVQKTPKVREAAAPVKNSEKAIENFLDMFVR